MLYILKLVCLPQKYGKNKYVVHIKTSMFTTEIRKKRLLYIVKLVCLLQKYGKKNGNTAKTGMLYILKLVCLLQRYGKNGYVVHIETSMFSTEKMAMLYIRSHKVHELSVE